METTKQYMERLTEQIKMERELNAKYREHLESLEMTVKKLEGELEMERCFRRQLQRKMLNKAEDEERGVLA